MTDDAFDYLPPLLAGFCSFVPRFAEANRAGVPWSQFDFEEPHPAETKVFARDDNTFVEQSFLDGELWTEDVFSIIGRGDFDSDGQDDLLVQRELVQIVTDPLLRLGTGLDSLVLLTRNAPAGVLRATASFSPFGSVARACFVDPAYLRPRE
ncbi:MAG: hypothetical protein IID55_06295 [Proteobacteria bacterium]|nr:hypothetical protein [Pseudomonadota bacterium]